MEPISLGQNSTAGPDAPARVPGASAAVSTVVLDTNVVLDWLWFGDARVQPMSQAVCTGRVQWVGSDAMRAELEAVLARGHLRDRGHTPESVLAGFDRWCRLDEPGATSALRCSDPDDQKFLDLALARTAAALFTRDRCVLRLARRARAFGLWVGPPEGWPG